MGQGAISGEVSLSELDTNDSLKTISTSENVQDLLPSDEGLSISEINNLESENVQNHEILQIVSNSVTDVLTNMNNEHESQSLQKIEDPTEKWEIAVVKSFEEEMEKKNETDLAINTDITQDHILNKTIANFQNKQDSDCVCSPSKDILNAIKKEILRELPLLCEKPSTERIQDNILKSSKEKGPSIFSDKNMSIQKGTDSENITRQSLKPRSKHKNKPKNKEISAEIRSEIENVKEEFAQNRRTRSKPLKCRSWNKRASSGEFTSKVKSSFDSTGRRSETLSLEHTEHICESPRETFPISSKIHRGSPTIAKMGKLQEVSKRSRSKEVPISSINSRSNNHKCHDFQCEKTEVFPESQSHFSMKAKTSNKINTKLQPSKNCHKKDSPEIIVSSTSQKKKEKKKEYKPLKQSDVDLSSYTSLESKLNQKKDNSEESNLSCSPDKDTPYWSIMKYHNIPNPDSSIEFLQDEISKLLDVDKSLDIVKEMAKLTERNLELQTQLSQKEIKIDKLAQRSESVIKKCEEIEVGLVSNLVITDERIPKLSQATNIVQRIELENKVLWNQIEKLRKILSEKDREISRLLHEKNSEGKKDEIKALKEKLSYLEHEHATLSLNLKKSENLCRQYENDLEGLEKNLKFAEDRLRLTFIDLQDIVKSQADKRQPESETSQEKRIENNIFEKSTESEVNKKKEKQTRKNDGKVKNASYIDPLHSSGKSYQRTNVKETGQSLKNIKTFKKRPQG